MKISSLISELQKIKDAQGDIDVIRINDGEYSSVDWVEFDKDETFFDDGIGEMRIGVPVVKLI